MAGIERRAPPKLMGPPDADVTLIGWGSTEGVIAKRWRSSTTKASPPTSFRSAGWCRSTASASWRSSRSRHTIIVENNYSGQFARYLRSETSFVAARAHPQVRRRAVHAASHRRGGEGAAGRQDQLSVPVHEIMV